MSFRLDGWTLEVNLPYEPSLDSLKHLTVATREFHENFYQKGK